MALSKLFISYPSLDSAKVDTIVSRLSSLLKDDGTRRYTLWQDKTSIPGGQDWWLKIVEGIKNCEVFIFIVSRAALDSVVCRAELSYAYKLNLPIIPVVLQGEHFFNHDKGKNDITYWDDLPQELLDLNAQFLFYEGTSFYTQFEDALLEFERKPIRRNKAVRPPNPIDGKNDIQIYQEACDFALNLDFDKAEKHFQKLVNRHDSSFRDHSYDWIQLLREYQDIVIADTSDHTRYQVEELWEEYKKKLPKPFITLFDPKNFADRFTVLESEVSSRISLPQTSRTQSSISKMTMEEAFRSLDEEGGLLPTKSSLKVNISQPDLTNLAKKVKTLIPEPFEWCYVPEGIVYISKKAVTLQAFMIGKYTLTTQQFDVFINDDDGYMNGEWWGFSNNAIQWRSRNITPSLPYTPLVLPVTQSPFSKGSSKKKQEAPEKHYPRTNINWYEAIAFCRWLSNKTDLKITLPSPQQWQRAARGDTKRKYAWGEVPDVTRACYSHYGGYPAEVTEYSFGASPFGALNMCGNVHELTQNSVKRKINEEISIFGKTKIQPSTIEVIKAYGGSYQSSINDITCSSHVERQVEDREKDIGFRIVLNLKD